MKRRQLQKWVGVVGLVELVQRGRKSRANKIHR